jgi:hypothetical protein
MNFPKFIEDDERLFRLLLGDLFPSLELPVSEYGGDHPPISCQPLSNQCVCIQRHSSVRNRERVGESKSATTRILDFQDLSVL